MTDLASALEFILREHGVGILDSRSRLLALLREAAPDAARDAHLLVTAVDAGVPARLLEAGERADDILLGQESAQLVDHFGIDPNHAGRAVAIWAEATRSLARAGGRGSQPGNGQAAVSVAPAREPDVTSARASEAPPRLGPPAATAPVPSRGDASPNLPGASRTVPSDAPAPLGTLPPIQPLPDPNAAGVRPLPGMPPLPGVQALPGVQPLPPAQPKPDGRFMPGPNPPPPAPGRWSPGILLRIAVPAGALAIAGALWVNSQYPDLFGGAPAPKPPAPAPRPGSPPAGPASPAPRPAQPPQPAPGPVTPGPVTQGPAGGTTADGHPILGGDTKPKVKAERVEGAANSILFNFGLRFGGETYTYLAAARFWEDDAPGSALIRATAGGLSTETEPLTVKRGVESDGFVQFVLSGRLKPATVKAPSVCVAAIAGKSPGALDLGNGGGLFCAFGTTESGTCDDKKRFGCADLVP